MGYLWIKLEKVWSVLEKIVNSNEVDIAKIIDKQR